jgi:hypothetical protein
MSERNIKLTVNMVYSLTVQIPMTRSRNCVSEDAFHVRWVACGHFHGASHLELVRAPRVVYRGRAPRVCIIALVLYDLRSSDRRRVGLPLYGQGGVNSAPNSTPVHMHTVDPSYFVSRMFHCDYDTVLTGGNVTEYLNSRHLKIAVSAPYCHHQNGQVERAMQTVLDKARVMLAASQAPASTGQMAAYLVMRSLTVPILGHRTRHSAVVRLQTSGAILHPTSPRRSATEPGTTRPSRVACSVMTS